ncbi:MAG: homocysteine S-methyltransferase family protein [Lactobacillaceae bacterium]|jgi:5-methyltetrahydrofolate--homocysteine methyltransferase|nr:homocysteine S-methyltransferase family protein [Lactobacillaceae bacterium]
MTIIETIAHDHLVFDGAMGTQLQNRGLPVGENPEYFNLTHPEVVQAIHAEYVAAGADVITTNTFQANRSKLPAEQLPAIITTAVKLARQAGARYVAYDMGPIGQLMAPMGTLAFDDAYEQFAQQAILAEHAGADVILIETLADLYEAKAAILAVKENTALPVFVTLTYQADGRTFVGVDPKTATITLQALGADAVGVNCSLGPVELAPVVAEILQYAKVPVLVQANAGLPDIENGETVYRITPEDFGAASRELLAEGVRVIGGCCGTTPEFTRQLRAIVDATPVVAPNPVTGTFVTSALTTVEIKHGELTLIGERINPTGKKLLKEALRNHDISYILKEAVQQKDAGADILDVNVGLPEIDEAQMMQAVIQELQGVIATPLQIDSSSIEALEAGCRYYNGRPLLNSVSGEADKLAQILPIAKKYGAVILGLCLDEGGIPETAQGRLAIGQKIVATAAEYGLAADAVMLDPLVLTASAQQAQVAVTLETLRLIKQELGVKTVIGLSNVSFGLPNRSLLNGTFLAQAFGAGLTTPIMNPLNAYMMSVVQALRVFTTQDLNSEAYIANNHDAKIAVASGTTQATTTQANASELTLTEMILSGRKELTAAATKALLAEGATPLAIVNEYFIPALNIVGDQFEKGEMFLPQLMQSAESVAKAQEVLKVALANDKTAATTTKGQVLLATVEGDIHDIGKNIVKMILENYGYQIYDLGKDVQIQQVVDTIIEHDIKLVGLSALMTTTVQNMKKTIAAVKAAGLTDVQFMVGGAVLNEEYRDFVGADYYAKDAMASVVIVNEFFS